MQFDNKFFGITIHRFIPIFEINNPDYKNWYRLIIFTPFSSIYIKGWLFWGKKPINQ